jgi:hypothetical protein
LAAAAQNSVDVITLRNGSIIRGKITEQNTQMVKIYTTNRKMVEVKRDEIQKMEKENSVPQNPAIAGEADITTRGNMIIGGSAWLGFDRFKYSSGDDDSQFGISLNPAAAWFLADYLAVGAAVDLGFSVNDEDIYYNLGIGPIVKYYLAGGLFFSGQISVGLDHYPSYNYTRFALKPGVGYAIFLSRKVALEPALVYEFRSAKYKSDLSESTSKAGSLRLEAGFTIFL